MLINSKFPSSPYLSYPKIQELDNHCIRSATNKHYVIITKYCDITSKSCIFTNMQSSKMAHNAMMK